MPSMGCRDFDLSGPGAGLKALSAIKIYLFQQSVFPHSIHNSPFT